MQGWTPDGKRVVFASSRGFIEDFNRLYSVPLEGGLEEPLPMPTGPVPGGIGFVFPAALFAVGVAAAIAFRGQPLRRGGYVGAALLLACVAPALAFSNALALSTTRELALRLGPSERDDARRLFATAAMLALAAGGVIVILLALVGAPLARLGFHLSGPSGDDLGLAFVLAGAGWLCQCLSAIFLALFTARQDYRRVASISIISTDTCQACIWPFSVLRTALFSAS